MSYYDNIRIGGALDSDHIYYNINISNNYTNRISVVTPPSLDNPLTTTTLVSLDTRDYDVPLEFNQNRAQPYLVNPSEYFLSVQRFSIESPNLPVFIAQPILGEIDPNKTVYSITLINNSTTVTKNIVWQPQNTDTTRVPVPSTPITQSSLNNPYYYCYSYQWFLKCINDTLDTMGVVNHPYMSFNTVTKLFTIQGRENKYRTSSTGALIGTVANLCAVYMNTALYNLFSSIPAIYKNAPNGLDYQILFTTGSDVTNPTSQPYIINVVTNGSTNDVYSTQEYNSLPLWTPVKSIVFRGSLLNVVSDVIGTPVVYQDNVNINAGKPNTDILPILIEHSVQLNTGTEYKPYIYYEPTGEYRLADLYSDIPVYGLQFNVFWKDSFGNLIPFLLSIGSSATMKILFRKKSFNSDKI